jgi:hypothetical protein
MIGIPLHTFFISQDRPDHANLRSPSGGASMRSRIGLFFDRIDRIDWILSIGERKSVFVFSFFAEKTKRKNQRSPSGMVLCT